MWHPQMLKWARTIRGKLQLLFSTLVIVTIGALACLAWVSEELNKANRMLQSANSILLLETALINRLHDQSRALKSYIEIHDPTDLTRARETGKFQENLRQLSEQDLIQSNPEYKAYCGVIKDKYQELKEKVDSDAYVNELKSVSTVDALTRSIRDALSKLDGAIKLPIDKAATAARESALSNQRVLNFLPLFLVIVVGVYGLIVIYIQRRLSNRLREMERATHYVTRGDFNHRIKEIHGRDELTDLALAYNSMASRLSELESLKREFVSHISHELKNPLAAIKQVNDFLTGGLFGSLNEKQKDMLRISQKNSIKLTDMVNNLLDISKMEAGVMEYRMQEEDLISVIRNCIHEMTPVCEERNIKIGTVFVQPKLIFSFDNPRIGQVINNLLGNAIKFTPDGGIIIVRADRVDSALKIIPERYRIIRSNITQAKGYAIVSVEDTGVGVPKGELDNIFEKFYQIQNGHKARGGGTGLGLAISKSIIEAHEGFIWAEPGNRAGTSFRFVLPLDAKVVTKTLHIIKQNVI